MFNWLKPLSKTKPANQGAEQLVIQSPRDKIIAEAMQNAKTAREAIGQEKLDKLRVLMEKKNQPQAEQIVTEARSPMEQAKKILKSMDSTKLTDNLRALRNQVGDEHK